MTTIIMSLERKELYTFCDSLPEPIIARPVLIAKRGRGLVLALEFDGKRVKLIEDGKLLKFNSVDEVMFELDGAPNIDTANISIETNSYWQH
jgi:hypothetical protein